MVKGASHFADIFIQQFLILTYLAQCFRLVGIQIMKLLYVFFSPFYMESSSLSILIVGIDTKSDM